MVIPNELWIRPYTEENAVTVSTVGCEHISHFIKVVKNELSLDLRITSIEIHTTDEPSKIYNGMLLEELYTGSFDYGKSYAKPLVVKYPRFKESRARETSWRATARIRGSLIIKGVKMALYRLADECYGNYRAPDKQGSFAYEDESLSVYIIFEDKRHAIKFERKVRAELDAIATLSQESSLIEDFEISIECNPPAVLEHIKSSDYDPLKTLAL